jgi:hypothetical protein
MKTPNNRIFTTASTTWALTSMGPRSHQLAAGATAAPEVARAPRWSSLIEATEHDATTPIDDVAEGHSPLLEGTEKDEQ